MSDSGSDLKKELNQLWRSTVGQLDELKDVIVKSSHAGKARLDAAFLERERDNRLQELGRLCLEGKDKDGYPDAWVEKIKEINELTEQIESQKQEFDDLVQDVKDSIPDLSEAPGVPEDAEPTEKKAPSAGTKPEAEVGKPDDAVDPKAD